MKAIILSTLALCVALGTAQASEIFILTDTPDVNINTGNSHYEEAFNFTALPDWSDVTSIDSVEVIETFSSLSGSPTFSSTIIPYDTTVPNGGSAKFTLFGSQSLTSTTESVTYDVPSPLTLADITTGGTLGEFDTRVSRATSGSFTLDSVEVEITAELTPEPSTFLLMGLGLAAVAFFARRSSARARSES